MALFHYKGYHGYSAKLFDYIRQFTASLSFSQIRYQHTSQTDTTELSDPTKVEKDDDSDNYSQNNLNQSLIHKQTGLFQSSLDRSRRYGLVGWRFGVTQFAAWATLVFAINFTLAIWGAARHVSTKGILMEGNCKQMKDLNKVIHVFINVLSTIILAGSNYCMQCLSAPSRTEVDKAHKAHRWLDIGILSFRNLKHISRRKSCAWMVLAISSLPLHFL